MNGCNDNLQFSALTFFIRYRTFSFGLFSFLSIWVSACSVEENAQQTLSSAIDKLTDAAVLSYSCQMDVNNIFNETKASQTAKVDFYSLENSHHGYGLHAVTDQIEYFYDGYRGTKLEHASRRMVLMEAEEIKNDPDFFSRFTFFSNHPRMILNDYAFAAIRDTLVNEKECFAYKDEFQRKSSADTTEIVRYQKWFFIEKKIGDIIQITDITIREKDTLQVVDCFFTDYSYGVMAFPKIDPKYEMEYVKVKEEDADAEFTYVPIKEGEKLSKSIYVDVNGREISLFGKDEKSCLIMFSFIGCAPCEMALKDFREANYEFSGKVNFYYSSFQNDSSALKHYLIKKEFPNTAFGKESLMIDEFSLYHAPSFVFFDSSGTILKVIEGYDEEVKATLFQLLSLPKD